MVKISLSYATIIFAAQLASVWAAPIASDSDNAVLERRILQLPFTHSSVITKMADVVVERREEQDLFAREPDFDSSLSKREEYEDIFAREDGSELQERSAEGSLHRRGFLDAIKSLFGFKKEEFYKQKATELRKKAVELRKKANKMAAEATKAEKAATKAKNRAEKAEKAKAAKMAAKKAKTAAKKAAKKTKQAKKKAAKKAKEDATTVNAGKLPVAAEAPPAAPPASKSENSFSSGSSSFSQDTTMSSSISANGHGTTSKLSKSDAESPTAATHVSDTQVSSQSSASTQLESTVTQREY